MLSTIVIADDLTGANASGVLLNELGMKVMVALGDGVNTKWVDENKDLDGLVIPTNSRAEQAEVAYAKVYQLTKFFEKKQHCIFNKRIDSTLRGNIGAEIDAMLDGVQGKRIAFVVPVYPASKRACVGGYMLVNGVILQNTSVAKDPKTPIFQSKVKSIIEGQSRRKVGEIFIDIIEQGSEAIRNKITELVVKGMEIIVFDGIEDEHIECIAKAVSNCRENFITVDPGPFLQNVVKYMIKNETQKNLFKILLTVGSVTDLTKEQIKYLLIKEKIFYKYLDALMLMEQCEKFFYLDQMVANIVNASKEFNIVCITTTNLYEGYLLDLQSEAQTRGMSLEEASNKINKSLAYITRQILSIDSQYKGLFSSGGDTTVAIAEMLGGKVLEVRGEIMPMAVYGMLYINDGDGVHIATKGGFIGDKDGIYKCVYHLKQQIKKKGCECNE